MSRAALDRPRGFDSIVELFGEQSVQLTAQVTAMIVHSAWVLVVGTLFMLLSVHLATSAVQKPAVARVPTLRVGRLVLPERSQMPWELGLQTSLPTRGPPGVGDRSLALPIHESSPGSRPPPLR
jgi:hypothetical protein